MVHDGELLIDGGSAGTFHVDEFSPNIIPNIIIDDFESGVAPGTPCVGIPLDFCTFADSASVVNISAVTTPPAPVLPELGEPNTVMQVDLDVKI